MGPALRLAVIAAVVACAAVAAFGCRGDDDRLSVEEFVGKADAVCVRERRAMWQVLSVKTYRRERIRMRADYLELQPPPEQFAAAFREYIRAFDDLTRANVLIGNNPRVVATLRDSGAAFGSDRPTDDVSEMARQLKRDIREAHRVLNRDEHIGTLIATQELADARVEVARLRLSLPCGEKLARSTREARVHNSVAPMCLFYRPDVLAMALHVDTNTKTIAHALRELTGLPDVEPACLEGFADQRDNG